MKTGDWLFVNEDRIHNYRSAGVLIHEGKLLIQKGIHDTVYALPGGHVSWGETSAEAVVREYKEELGAEITVERLIWLEETFWKWGAKDAHTLCHYHLVHLNSPSQIPLNGIFKSIETDESKLIFQWVNLNDLQEYKIYPVFLKDHISKLPIGIEHFVSREESE